MDRNTLATQDDIAQLKADLVRDFKDLIQKAFGDMPNKRWLKSADVKKLLGISHGFLQALRDDGTLPFTKLGGAIYYDYQDIIQMMAANKNQ
ncbi:MAG: DNA-binding protein [Chthonomonadaceae bacterium]|nr:DNA-binding protein [Chthonomonadaceae bacterium]